METTTVQFQVPISGLTNLYFHSDVNTESTLAFIKDFNKLASELSDIENKNANKLNQYFGISHDAIKKTPIHIHMNTPGGYCYDGFSMYSYIKDKTKERKITITCSGIIASMGIALLLSVPIEHRKAHANTTFMIHQVSGFALGKVADMEETVEEAKRLHNILFDIIEANTKITKDQLNKCYENKKDWFMSAEEALEAGLISEIIR